MKGGRKEQNENKRIKRENEQNMDRPKTLKKKIKESVCHSSRGRYSTVLRDRRNKHYSNTTNNDCLSHTHETEGITFDYRLK